LHIVLKFQVNCSCFQKGVASVTRNSSGDETVNVNFLYDDIVRFTSNVVHLNVRQSTAPSPICTTLCSYNANA